MQKPHPAPPTPEDGSDQKPVQHVETTMQRCFPVHVIVHAILTHVQKPVLIFLVRTLWMIDQSKEFCFLTKVLLESPFERLSQELLKFEAREEHVMTWTTQSVQQNSCMIRQLRTRTKCLPFAALAHEPRETRDRVHVSKQQFPVQSPIRGRTLRRKDDFQNSGSIPLIPADTH